MGTMLIMVMMVMVLLIGCHDLPQDLCLQIGSALDRVEDLLSVELCDRCGDDGCLLVVLPNQGNRLIDLLLRGLVGSCQHDGAGILDLVREELPEVLEIQLRLGAVHHSHRTVELHPGNFCCGLLDGAHHVIELSHARGLNKDPLRSIGCHDLLEGGVEVSHQGAADATGVHLADLDAGLLQEAPVNADLAELVLNQNDLCSCQCVLDQLADQRGLAGSKKAGYDIYLCLCHMSYLQIYPQLSGACGTAGIY